MDYAYYEKRTTRKDLKRRRLYNRYKKGGSLRTRNKKSNNGSGDNNTRAD